MTVPHRMTGVQLVSHGGPEALVVNPALRVPTPARGDVLVRVGAAAVNNTDINTRTGWYSKGDADAADASWSGHALQFPRIQGADVCGAVVAVGAGVPENRIGQRVLIEPCLRSADGEVLARPWYLGSECDGGFAEFVRVASVHAYAVDSALSDAALASFPCSYSTAENMLTRAAVEPGETVLVTGASGGVGSAAVQLARARGAAVVAVTSPAKAEALRGLGAGLTVGRDANLVETLGRDSVDVVLDLVAGAQWPQFLDILRPGGRYAVSGAIGGPLVELDVRTLYLKDLSFFGCTVLQPGVFGTLVRLIERGAIRPLVAETWPLTAIHEAQARFLKKDHIGKIVLSP